MAGDLGGHGAVEVVDQVAGHVHGGVRGAQKGAVVLLRHFQQLGRGVHAPGHDHGRERIAEELVEHAAALRLRHAVQVAHFAAAQYLQALVVEVVVKAHQLECGAVHVGNGDDGGIEITAAVEDLHVEGLDHFFQAGRVAFYFFHGRSSCPERANILLIIISCMGFFRNTFQAQKIFVFLSNNTCNFTAYLLLYQLLAMQEVMLRQQGGATDGKVRILRQGRDLWYQGVPFSPAFQSSLEAQCQARQGCGQRHASPCVRLYQMPAFRQGHSRYLIASELHS